MPTGPLPPSDNYLGDGDRTTGEFQAEINNLQNWARQFQAQLDALSSTTPGEAFNRAVGDSAGQLTARGVGTGLTQLVETAQLNTRLSTTGNLGVAATLGYESIQVELNGDFTSGQFLRCTRIGDLVTIQSLGGGLSHVNTSSPSSLSDLIPERFRPITGESAFNVYYANSGAGVVCVSQVFFNGALFLTYPSLSGAGNASRSDSIESISMSYWTDRAFS